MKAKFSIESRLELVPSLVKNVREFCSHASIEDNLLYQIELCIGEAVENVIVHAYQRKSDQIVDVSVSIQKNQITFEIADTGIPFTPSSQLNLDNIFQDNFRMGLFLLHKLMDRVIYSRKDGKNLKTFVKEVYTYKKNC